MVDIQGFCSYHHISQIRFFSALALQCYTGQTVTPATQGVPPVKLEACPPEATRCANTETVAEIAIPNQSPIKSTMKLGQCANETICDDTLNCDKAKSMVPGLKSCNVSVTVSSKQISGRFCSKFFFIKSM